MDEKELAKLFRMLGARDPESWAHSQIEEDLPQLARFLFLRQAWRLVTREDDLTWIARGLAASEDRPGGGIAPALKRLMASGASEHDLTMVVRVMQWKILSGLCQLLDDPAIEEEKLEHIAWRLFQVDESDQPIAAMSGLVESVLDTDPAGNEMRPRKG